MGKVKQLSESWVYHVSNMMVFHKKSQGTISEEEPTILCTYSMRVHLE